MTAAVREPLYVVEGISSHHYTLIADASPRDAARRVLEDERKRHPDRIVRMRRVA